MTAKLENIEMFSAPGCTYCDQAKLLLREHNLDFDEYDTTDPGHLNEFRRRLPRTKSLPQIFASGEHLGGYEDLALLLSRSRPGSRTGAT